MNLHWCYNEKILETITNYLSVFTILLLFSGIQLQTKIPLTINVVKSIPWVYLYAWWSCSDEFRGPTRSYDFCPSTFSNSCCHLELFYLFLWLNFHLLSVIIILNLGNQWPKYIFKHYENPHSQFDVNFFRIRIEIRWVFSWNSICIYAKLVFNRFLDIM